MVPANVFTLLYNIKSKILLSFSMFMPPNFKFELTIKLSGGYEFTQRETSFYNERHSL